MSSIGAKLTFCNFTYYIRPYSLRGTMTCSYTYDIIHRISLVPLSESDGTS